MAVSGIPGATVPVVGVGAMVGVCSQSSSEIKRAAARGEGSGRRTRIASVRPPAWVESWTTAPVGLPILHFQTFSSFTLTMAPQLDYQLRRAARAQSPAESRSLYDRMCTEEHTPWFSAAFVR